MSPVDNHISINPGTAGEGPADQSLPGACLADPGGGRASVRKVGWHECGVGWQYDRITWDPIIGCLQARVGDRRLGAVGGAEDISSRRQPQIDGLLGYIETARDLLRRLMLKQQVEAGALLVGQAGPALVILGWVRPRITHIYTLVKMILDARGGR